MAHIVDDLVYETSATAGTGAITPNGAKAGFLTIGSKMAAGDTAYFAVTDGTVSQVFLGTWNGTTVTRTTGLSGTSGTGNVNLSGTGGEIWITIPAAFIRGTTTAGLAYSDGQKLLPATIGGGLQLTASTLQAQMPRDLKTDSYTIVASDRGKIIEYTGSVAATITLTAAATLGAGWYCILKHSGTGTTGLTKRLDISGTLDTVSNPAVYPGDTRIIQSDGSALTSILLVGGFLQLLASDSTFTFTRPTGAMEFRVFAVGSGGAGGFGGTYIAGSGSGGGGGGGAGSNYMVFRASGVPASVPVIVGATAAGGASGVTPTGGTIAGQGARGGVTSFGALAYAGGGGGGAPGVLGSASGGGGSGAFGSVTGGFGTNVAGGGAGQALGGAGGLGAMGSSGLFAGAVNIGTGGGGCGSTGVSFQGGNTWGGASGGGSGGGFNSAAAAAGAISGGALINGNINWASGGGAATVGASGSANTVPAMNTSNGGPGGGGGGGGAGSAANGGAGGAGGGFGAGGGGGGAGDSALGRVGGNGGAGAPAVVMIGYGP